MGTVRSVEPFGLSLITIRPDIGSRRFMGKSTLPRPHDKRAGSSRATASHTNCTSFSRNSLRVCNRFCDVFFGERCVCHRIGLGMRGEAHKRARVRVRSVEQQLTALQPCPFLDLLANVIGDDGRLEADKIGRHDHRAPAVTILQSECLGMNIRLDGLERPGAIAITQEHDRLRRSNHHSGEAGLPDPVLANGRTRQQDGDSRA